LLTPVKRVHNIPIINSNYVYAFFTSLLYSVLSLVYDCLPQRWYLLVLLYYISSSGFKAYFIYLVWLVSMVSRTMNQNQVAGEYILFPHLKLRTRCVMNRSLRNEMTFFYFYHLLFKTPWRILRWYTVNNNKKKS